jgi:hypothetical protein
MLPPFILTFAFSPILTSGLLSSNQDISSLGKTERSKPKYMASEEKV